MADKTTESKELKLQMLFTDNDDRTLTLNNPKNGLTASDVKAVATTFKETGVIIGDKAGAPFVGFKTAKVVKQKRTDFDLRQ